MNQIEFISKFEEIVEAETGEISGKTLLADVEGWDSLAVMGFIAMVDEEFGLSLEPKALKSCNSVQDLVRLVGPLFQ